MNKHEHEREFLRHRINGRAFQIFTEGVMSGRDLTLEQAKAQAARQIASEQRKQKHHTPKPSSSEHPSLLNTLRDMASRMNGPPPEGDSLMAKLSWFIFGSKDEEPTNAPVVAVTPSPFKDKVAHAVHKLAAAVGVEPKVEAAERQAPEVQHPLLYTGQGDARSAHRLDDEFPKSRIHAGLIPQRRTGGSPAKLGKNPPSGTVEASVESPREVGCIE